MLIAFLIAIGGLCSLYDALREKGRSKFVAGLITGIIAFAVLVSIAL